MVNCIPFIQKEVYNPNFPNDLAHYTICQIEPISVLTIVVIILFFIGLWVFLKKKK